MEVNAVEDVKMLNVINIRKNKIYIIKKMSTKVQSILIPTKKTFAQAVKWVSLRGYKINQITEEGNYWHFRQKNPNKNKTYYSKKLKNGIIFVFFKG